MAKDIFHEAAKKALEKDGWTITHDSLQLLFGKRTLSVHLGAERSLIGATRGSERIGVAIKTFGGASPVADFQQILDQFMICKSILAIADPERELYIAVSEEVRDSILSEDLGLLILKEHINKVLSFSVELEEIIEWKT